LFTATPLLLTQPFSSEVKGDHGVVLRDEFDPEPQVYLSFAVPKFPNYFIINGPRGNWASGSALASVSSSQSLCQRS
jgi:hypothetical protein